MGQILHGSATTTEVIRGAIQNSEESLRALWYQSEDRGEVAQADFGCRSADLPTGSKDAKSTVLTPDEEAMIVAFPMVKDSLGHALRLIRPIVVMDEGQKATSELAYSTLYGFNPTFVLVLTATPKDVRATATSPASHANLLVEVMGRELHAEDMIKMPLNLDPRQGTDWRGTLTVALGKLSELGMAADALRAEAGRYIRPIMLVQVERTGKVNATANIGSRH